MSLINLKYSQEKLDNLMKSLGIDDGDEFTCLDYYPFRYKNKILMAFNHGVWEESYHLPTDAKLKDIIKSVKPIQS